MNTVIKMSSQSNNKKKSTKKKKKKSMTFSLESLTISG